MTTDVMEKKPDKKTLKRLIARHFNKRDQLMYQFTDARDREQERIEENKEKLEPKRESETPRDDAGEQLWSAKTQEIRNRLNDKKRDSKDRWNRFAGTEGGGGRGL